MLVAEKYAGHSPIKRTHAWLPMLEKVGQTITFWKLQLTKVREGHVNPERIQRLAEKLKIIDTNPKGKKEVMAKIKAARNDLKKVQ